MPRRGPPTPSAAARRESGRTGIDGAERVYIPDREAWRAWLQLHHTRAAPIWLIYDKKSAGATCRLTWDDIVEEALCFGWIDSVVRNLSAKLAMQ